LQILDSYHNRTYANGQAGSKYKQSIPLVNPARKPGEWQSYDAIWMAPIFNANGDLQTPAYVTVFFNGVLVQNHFELKGETLYIGKPFYRKFDSAPIKLQAHPDPIMLLLQRPVSVVGTGRHYRQRGVDPRQKLGFQVVVGLLQGCDPSYAHAFHQPVLSGQKSAFYPPFGLWTVRRYPRDCQLPQRGRSGESQFLTVRRNPQLVTRSISGRPVIRPESVVGDYSSVAAFPARAETSSLIPSCLLA
jgi:hypothetical protein